MVPLGKFTRSTEASAEVIEGIQGFSRAHDPFSSLPVVFCPELVGRYDVKRGLMCMLANRIDRDFEELRRRRERLHILLYGTPGTGKTIPLDYLSRDWSATYISANPSSASLKGDARRKDRGVQIFASQSGLPICIDEFELMEDTDILRDVMELGKYTITKGGTHEEYDAQCSIVAATNDLTCLSPAMLSRFDLVYSFDPPTYEESVEIAKNLLEVEENGTSVRLTRDFLREHINLSGCYDPDMVERDRILSEMERHFRTTGRGKTGRWIASVYRISRAIAKIRFTDWGVEEVRCAIRMKAYSDVVIDNAV